MPDNSPANVDTCRLCPGDCLDACFNDAITAAAGGGVFIDVKFCAGCGACIPVCPLGRIALHQGVARLAASTSKHPDAAPAAPVESE